MNKKHQNSKPLAPPREALGFYLDSLLMDIPAELPDETSASAELAAKPAADPSVNRTAETTEAPSPAATSSSQKATQKPILIKAQEDPPSASLPAPGAAAASVVPLKVERREIDSRPFAELKRPQPLLSGPPVIPLLAMDVSASVTLKKASLVEKLTLADISVAPQIEKTPASATVDVDTVDKALEETTGKTPASVELPEMAAAPVSAPASDSTSSPDPSGGKSSKSSPCSDVPVWAENRFQCLSFMVAGVTLAAPLERLHGIIEWQGEITALPGYATWFMGLQPNRGQNVRVIDTAQIIMPDGRRPDARPTLERVQYVVLMDGGRWGLAVDAIGEVLMLECDDIRWRGERSKRPWLAGTAVEQMCAVLDIDSLSEQLTQGLKLDEE